MHREHTQPADHYPPPSEDLTVTERIGLAASLLICRAFDALIKHGDLIVPSVVGIGFSLLLLEWLTGAA